MRSLDGVDVAAAGQRLGGRDELDAGLDAARAGPRTRSGRPPGSAAVRAAISASRRRAAASSRRRSRRRRSASSSARVRKRSASARPVLDRPGMERRVLRRTSGVPSRAAATIATSAAPRRAATAEALPPPGTGSAEASRRDELVDASGRGTGRAIGSTRPIVHGRATAATAPSSTMWHGVGAGRARYRRARPDDRRAASDEPGRDGPRDRAAMLCAGQAARGASSRPVTVQRRERCWNVRDSRARGVSTSNSVRGPVMTG